ncbi:ATP-dependent DNA helicase, Rep family [Pseudorhodobacter antarcticus]|uniref:DNA 3'-5' helicase n=1 Tax=Pseudorhodobacter antarcticus TaxID=1077947 RepID=A0A1H8M3L8_9RHOB|nr:UvrD-helicase domain-containing protein [Pseudorhodobacter antarcticus]SEO11963.1 ATP-dependent DNA helicase, Rep family [Pseudorhodobacter antarcticus]
MNSYDENDAFEAAAAPQPAGLSLSQRAMAARPAPYMDGLNPAQRAAVEAMDGPVLMLAGAGTGKTKALTTRIVHMLNTGRANPNEILAVTFTNKAAREMKDRVGRMMGGADGMKWMGTFHSISVKILRRHAELVGLKSNFTILDTDDQLRLLKQLIAANSIDEKRWPARMLAGLIDSWKNRAWTPEKVPSAEGSAYNNRGTELYAQYQKRLLDLNATDFGDLLLHTVTIFQTHPDILAQYQRWFKFILVDEYQDTNVAQYLWLRLLAQAHKNICCVGDDDQSIYGWRGAEVGNILRFESDFPGCHVVRLEQNYRSTPHILASASAVIAGNSGRLGKTLWTDETEGEKLRLIGHWDGEEEARWIGDEVEALQRGTRHMDPHSLDDMAILVRASHQMRAFEDRFMTIGLPYRVIGGPRFYERAEIRDAMAYFRLAISPADDLAFERIINTPKRGLGDKAQQSIQRTARDGGMPLLNGARRLLGDGGVSGKGAGQLRAFTEGMARWHEATLVPDYNHITLAEAILEESGYIAMWQNDKTLEAPGRLENLKELVKALEQFENLQGFLEHVSLIMDNTTEEQGAKISIMTLHAAKGLEFPAVFLPGWEDGLFPSQRSMDESGKKGLEEERRLAYVGITRAEKLCTISFAANRRVYGQWQSQLPSRFIDELPSAHVDILTPPGLYGGGFGAAAPAPKLEERVAQADVYNSPGWRRMQDRAAQRGTSQPREAKNTVIDLAAVSSFTIGDRVFHQKFGYGTIGGIEGDKLAVEFDKAGPKHVVAGFVTAADQSHDLPF